jgi:phosphatidylserine/phosphatidylglycerophosphate/cardiolipin synthase-like enzyme
MRRFLAVLTLLCAAIPAWADSPPAPDALPHGPLSARVWVCFVPAQQCDAPIAAAIRNARHTIRVQAYGFTAPVVLAALGEARTRGVDVRAILDKSNDPATRRDATRDSPKLVGAQFTAAMGIPTWIDHSVAIAHNKLIIIDGKVVIGGSYNFTVSAEERNAENVTFIESPEIGALYVRNWEERRAVSREYRPPQDFQIDRLADRR